jgi:hypothetical protein
MQRLRKARIDARSSGAMLHEGRLPEHMPIKPSSDKRTRTQVGLGKVTGGEPRHTTMRERIGEGAAADGRGTAPSHPPIDAPPPSGGPPSGGGIRTVTRSLEHQAAPGKPGKPPHDDRAEPDDDRPPPSIGRAERAGARTPIEVTQVDTKRIARQSAKPSRSAPPSAGFAPSRSRSAPPRSAPQSAPPRSSRFGAEEIATGRRAIAGRSVDESQPVRAETPAPSSRPGTPLRRGQRMSIREDNLGSLVGRAPDAVSGAARVVPKLVKTRAEIAAAPIDHRAGFLIAHIDGVTTVQGLVDIAGMPEEEVLEILERLRRLGIVALR